MCRSCLEQQVLSQRPENDLLNNFLKVSQEKTVVAHCADFSLRSVLERWEI